MVHKTIRENKNGCLLEKAMVVNPAWKFTPRGRGYVGRAESRTRKEMVLYFSSL